MNIAKVEELVIESLDLKRCVGVVDKRLRQSDQQSRQAPQDRRQRQPALMALKARPRWEQSTGAGTWRKGRRTA
jgi:hypothetical protein